MPNPMYDVLNPRSVAVIGASRNPTSFSFTYLSIMKNYGYQGRIYPINPRADVILGLKCYPTILDVPDEIDLAVVITGRQIAGTSVEACVEKGVKGIVLLTGGFAELDAEGEAIQNRFVRRAKEKGIRVIGPNTLGFYSAPVNFDGLLSGFIRKGNIGLAGQSGNLTRSLAFPGIKRGLGFRYIIGLGNQADVEFHEIVRYFREDEGVKVIALHIEGMKDGRKFMEEVWEATKVKPVVILKCGRTVHASRVISSHTASLSGEDAIYDSAFKQCGAIRIENTIEFSSLLLALSVGKLPKGDRIGVLSEGGGDCALTADACVLRNLKLPTFPTEQQERLREIVPEIGQVTNPVDMAMWQKIPEVGEIMLDGDAIDGLLIVGGFAGWDFLNPDVTPEVSASAQKMVEVTSKAEKPVLIYSYYSYGDSKPIDTLRQNGVPLFMDHHDAANAMAGMVQYVKYRSNLSGRRFESGMNAPYDFRRHQTRLLLENRANQMLESAGLPFPAYRVAETRQGAIDAADEIGYPVALKIISEDVIHKSDLGGVKLGLHTQDEVGDAFDAVVSNVRKFSENARISGALVSEMAVEDGVEVIIGGLRDSTFGPTVMFGLGGVFVETLADVAFRVCPIDRVDADEMIREIKGFPLLSGGRGRKPVDLASISTALLTVSRLFIENPHIAQLDLNPVKVYQRGLSVLDARVILYAE
jgi:acetyltransferase